MLHLLFSLLFQFSLLMGTNPNGDAKGPATPSNRANTNTASTSTSTSTSDTSTSSTTTTTTTDPGTSIGGGGWDDKD